MDTIQHEKKMEVGQYYLCGFTYAEIKKKTGISHGSVCSIVKELESGHLVIPGVAADKVHDLHQLSLDLTKKNLEPSNALLGITLFEKFKGMGIEPSQVEHWAKLLEEFSPANFPAKEFFEAALKLHQLEVKEGKSFEVLAEEYASMQQQSGDLNTEVDSLNQKKDDLNGSIKSTTIELDKLENKKKEINASIELQSKNLADVNTKVKAAGQTLKQTEMDIDTLQKQKIDLGAEVDGKQQAVKKLQELGFSEEDLLRLENTIERMAAKSGASPEQIKDQFFSALNLFGDFTGMKKAAQEESQKLQEARKQKSLLTGEIIDLENREAVLTSQVSDAASVGAEQIQAASKAAVTAIKHETDAIKSKLNALLEDAMVAGVAVGEMRAAQKNAEESGKEFERVLNEVKLRIEGSR